MEVCLLSPLVSPALGRAGSSSATPNLAGNLAEVVAMLIKCGAVRMMGKSAAPTAGDGNGESRHAAAGPVDGPALLPTDGKVGAGIQP